jgi:hypothetical protein
MSDYELTPLLTEKDEGESSEGGLDPLGTEPMADVLASRLAPGVRERQERPRFLTAIAVSRSLCADLGEEAIGRDGLTEPWLVFEWYVVQGLVLMVGRRPIDLRGLPGRLKAEQALRDNVPLSPKRYLKTPATTGFHGVYGVLAEALGIKRDGLLGEQGYELLSLWSKEQGLAGFCGHGKWAGQATARATPRGFEGRLGPRCRGPHQGLGGAGGFSRIIWRREDPVGARRSTCEKPC